MKRILIISQEVWRDESNGGNVLSNLFGGLQGDFEFAQIYCKSSLPNTSICKKFFQLSEADLVPSILGKCKMGRELSVQEIEIRESRDFTNEGIFYYLKQKEYSIISIVRDILWRIAPWKSEELRNFVMDFNPDVIFAPMYGYPFMSRIDKYVSEISGKKIVSYVSDEHLTLHQFSLDPFYWIHRLVLRHEIFSVSESYKMLYTMTDEQKEVYEKILHVPMKILRKGFDFTQPPKAKTVKHPIKLVYGGNLIYGRYKTLHKLKNVITQFNHEHGHFFELLIYTQTVITDKYRKLLHDGKNSFLMGKVSMEELNAAFSDAGIVLHVESLDLKSRLDTRMSFSTKIVDLLHSNCCVMAICWEKSSPYLYLTREKAAICVKDINDVYGVLSQIKKSPELISDYAKQAWECGCRNHDIYKINEMIKHDFNKLIEKQSPGYE